MPAKRNARLPTNATLRACQNVKQLPWVHVTWRDASTSTRWQPFREAHEHCPPECQTLGFLVRRTRCEVTVALSINAYGNASDCLTIPHDWVQRMRRVR